MKKLKILVISGFLGAGKTTFIKEMVKSTKREYVIFENEFGDVNIDGEILRNNTEEMKENNQKNGNVELNVWELTSGCACCSTKADFISSLLVIDNTLNPDFLIVEPSGIAILSNILKNVTNTGYDRIKMFPPITIIDAGTYFKYKNKYDEIFIDQIKMAAYIQLSKVENMADEELQLIYEDIKSFNPNADIFTNDYHNQNTDYWNALFSGELVKTENSDLKTFDTKKSMIITRIIVIIRFPIIFNFIINLLILIYFITKSPASISFTSFIIPFIMSTSICSSFPSITSSTTYFSTNITTC